MNYWKNHSFSTDIDLLFHAEAFFYNVCPHFDPTRLCDKSIFSNRRKCYLKGKIILLIISFQYFRNTGSCVCNERNLNSSSNFVYTEKHLPCPIATLLRQSLMRNFFPSWVMLTT